MPQVSFNTHCKHQKTRSFLMFSVWGKGGIERDLWHEMGLGYFRINQIANYIVGHVFCPSYTLIFILSWRACFRRSDYIVSFLTNIFCRYRIIAFPASTPLEESQSNCQIILDKCQIKDNKLGKTKV